MPDAWGNCETGETDCFGIMELSSYDEAKARTHARYMKRHRFRCWRRKVWAFVVDRFEAEGPFYA